MKTQNTLTKTAESRVSTANDTSENLEVWQDVIELAARVYELFRSGRDFSFRDQIQRAVASVSNNIAEGYERDTNAEFIRFLFIAKGSCGEVLSQAHLACRISLLTEEQSGNLVEEARWLSRRIARFIAVRQEKFV